MLHVPGQAQVKTCKCSFSAHMTQKHVHCTEILDGNFLRQVFICHNSLAGLAKELRFLHEVLPLVAPPDLGGGPLCQQANMKHITMFHCIVKVHDTLTMQPPTQGGQPLVVTKQACFQLSGCNWSQDRPCRCIKDLIKLPRQSDQDKRLPRQSDQDKHLMHLSNRIIWQDLLQDSSNKLQQVLGFRCFGLQSWKGCAINHLHLKLVQSALAALALVGLAYLQPEPLQVVLG